MDEAGMDVDETTILLVEDDDLDYSATKRALARAGLANPIHRCEDGSEALDYLFRRGTYSDPQSSPRPCIILLDLNLPTVGGLEVLQELKVDNELCRIPVIVLTTLDDKDDIESCYQAGANSYMRKPVSLAGYIEAIQKLKDYWFQIVLLPRV